MTQIPLKTARTLYKVVEEAIDLHRIIKEGLADVVVWENVVPTKAGGVLCIETLLNEGNYGDKKRRQLAGDLAYWNRHYPALRKEVFYRSNPRISPRKR